MTEYTSDDHNYDCDVPDSEITRALVVLDRPYESKRVLQYFHEELKYSTRQLADLFGVARQTLQDIVRPMEDFRFDRRNGLMTRMDLEQRTFDDYESEQNGLSDFL